MTFASRGPASAPASRTSSCVSGSPRVAGAGVGDERDPADLEPGPARGDALHDRRHPDGVAAERGVHPDLGRGLVVRAGQPDVDPFLERDVLGAGRAVEPLAQAGRPGVGHVREALADRWRIRADQRVLAGQVEVVADHHQRSGPERRIEPAGRIREHDHARAEAAEQQHRLDDEPRRVALVEVEAALEHDDGLAAERPEQQPADVARGRRGRPARQLVERDGDGVLEIVGEAAQPRAQDDPDLGHERRSRANGCLERVEARGLVRGVDGQRRVDHVRTVTECGPPELRPGVDGRGPATSAGPTRVPTPGCRSRPAEPPGDGAGTPSRPGTEAPEATGPGSKNLDVISVLRSLAAPSGKTKITNPLHPRSTTLSTSFSPTLPMSIHELRTTVDSPWKTRDALTPLSRGSPKEGRAPERAHACARPPRR